MSGMQNPYAYGRCPLSWGAASERRYLVWICHGCDECSKPYAERTAPCEGASMSGAWVKLAHRPPWMSEGEWQGPQQRMGTRPACQWAGTCLAFAAVGNRGALLRRWLEACAAMGGGPVAQLTQDTLDTLGGSAANASGGAEMAKDAAALPPAREPVMPTTPDALFEALARELPHWLPSGGEAAGSARAAARIITDRIIASTFRLDGGHDA